MSPLMMIQNQPTEYLDAIMMNRYAGRTLLFDAATWNKINPLHLMLWCRRHARYGIPTTELIEWLKKRIAEATATQRHESPAIEIGAGMGDLGFYLDIPMYDNYCQERPDVAAYYAALRMPIVSPPPIVHRADAIDAVRQAKPAVVIGSWITQKYRPGDMQGNVYGVDLEQLLDLGVTYIHIGNEAAHGDCRIMLRPHETHTLPFLVSRAVNRTLDRVWIWRPQ